MTIKHEFKMRENLENLRKYHSVIQILKGKLLIQIDTSLRKFCYMKGH